MKIDNLSVNMIVPNYKKLCELLEIKVLSSNSKKAQLKKLETLCKFKRVRNSYVILEIYDEPLELLDKREFSSKTLSYIEDMELLLLHFLAQTKKDVVISKSGLFKVLSMINNQYLFYNGNKRKLLSAQIEIDIDKVDAFYDMSTTTFKQSLNTILDRLERKRLIFYQSVKVAVRLHSHIDTTEEIKHTQHIIIDENNVEYIEYIPVLESDTKKTREIADDTTIKEILKIEKEVLKEMNLKMDTKAHYLVYINRYADFCKRVNKRLTEELNIAYTYNAYKILFNLEAVKEQIDHLMDKENVHLQANSKVVKHLQKKKLNFNDYKEVINSLIGKIIQIN